MRTSYCPRDEHIGGAKGPGGGVVITAHLLSLIIVHEEGFTAAQVVQEAGHNMYQSGRGWDNFAKLLVHVAPLNLTWT